MDNYNIPGDDGKSFRKKAFMSLLMNPEMGYVDGATDYCMLIPYAKHNKLTTDERIWLAFLYGLSYSQTTAIRMFHEFRDISSIDKDSLKNYWFENKESLWFNPDKKHLKNNDQVVPAIASFLKNTHRKPEEYLRTFSTGDEVYKAIKNTWRYFGPHGAYLFFDALYGLVPELYRDPSAIDWKNCGRTVGEGMAHFCYEDDLIETRQFPLDKYNKLVEKMQEKSGQPKVIVESTLCAFRKFFKKTRYVGYYADRMLEECAATQPYLKDIGVNVWKLRKLSIPEKYLGELNGWEGIRKDLCNKWLERGEL